MNNIHKYWFWRITTYVGLFASLWSLRQIMETMGNPGYMKWFIILVITVVLSLMAALKYVYYKTHRYDRVKSQQQITVETLAQLAQQRSNKQK